MAKAYLLGVDIGTYSSKGVLVDAETGNVAAAHVIEHGLSMPKPGWAEHDSEQVWWGEFVTICRDLIAMSGIDPRLIQSVGVSGIGPCVLPIDDKESCMVLIRVPLTRLTNSKLPWAGKRSSSSAPHIYPPLPAVPRSYGSKIMNLRFLPKPGGS
jgi:ribulose kinase